MRKTKIIIFTFIFALSSFLMIGCGKMQEEEKVEKPQTVAQTLKKDFENEIKSEKDIEKVAKKLSENEVLKISTAVEKIPEGSYVSGFTTEITDFKNAVAIKPMIGTIPFVAYIFESENPKDFVQTLRDNADLRWNICTEADEMETSVVGNYIFFVMSPKSFEEE